MGNPGWRTWDLINSFAKWYKWNCIYVIKIKLFSIVFQSTFHDGLSFALLILWSFVWDSSHRLCSYRLYSFDLNRLDLRFFVRSAWFRTFWVASSGVPVGLVFVSLAQTGLCTCASHVDCSVEFPPTLEGWQTQQRELSKNRMNECEIN